ncbi:MAG: hypothetical protein Q9208_003684 [Pyrenodesmia sp. 3 TL-2023]
MWNLQIKQLVRMREVRRTWIIVFLRTLIVDKWMYVAALFYHPTVFLVKLAILLEYLRMLAPSKVVNPALFIGARIIIVVVFVYSVISEAFTIFQCSPRAKMWDPLIEGGHCIDNSNAGQVVTGFVNITTDVAILVLPARTVWKLRIPRRKKFEIILLFATGLLACIANALIIYYSFLLGAKADVSYNAAWACLWAFAETTLGIIVICTFSLPKFIEAEGHMFRRAFHGIIRPFRTWSVSGSSAASDPYMSDTASKDTVMPRKVVAHGRTHDEEALN